MKNKNMLYKTSYTVHVILCMYIYWNCILCNGQSLVNMWIVIKYTLKCYFCRLLPHSKFFFFFMYNLWHIVDLCILYDICVSDTYALFSLYELCLFGSVKKEILPKLQIVQVYKILLTATWYMLLSPLAVYYSISTLHWPLCSVFKTCLDAQIIGSNPNDPDILYIQSVYLSAPGMKGKDTYLGWATIWPWWGWGGRRRWWRCSPPPLCGTWLPGLMGARMM